MSNPDLYPNLAKLNDNFWEALEDINTNEYGQLSIRAGRNAIDIVLRSEPFWKMAVNFVGRRVKFTTDPVKAAEKMETCDHLTEVLTNQELAKRLPSLTNATYEFLVSMDTELIKRILSLTDEIIDGGEFLKILDNMARVLRESQLDPSKVAHGFVMINKTLSMGGKANLGVFNGIGMKFASTLGTKRII